MREFLDDGRIEFRPARRDAQIRAEILSCLARAPWLDTRGVAVRVERGEVRLEGSVPERRTAQAVREIAARCAGVRSVAAHLRVARRPDPHL
ncbi:MAG TPA: BON domain-containing protein [Burkholderiales bacterium]|nr:BON domain-containing protein [Burkholderiales bacterium]